ncbi:keratin, type I cytoskeletal 18 [Carcharodon carcharias]|uniref:keratin, type I cytoskeletal 18 n=1 Tax=Carcharodon carcharias TaxID=13397 RepID=UPI001B7F5F35|nr:keratin, type I cytoskeletal 18 [Carcharodon carcharias]
MPSFTSSSSQRRTSSRVVPSFSSRSVQSSSWSKGPSSRSSAALLASAGTLLSGGGVSGSGSEKETMQGLNSRLAIYLEKVRSLETSNRDLELKIKALLEERKPVDRDIKPMLAQAHALNKQIQDLTMNNAVIMLQMDNAGLSAEDFRMKMESEALVRQSVESDIERLRRVKEEYDHNAITLRSEGEMMTEELLFLKKNHQEEVNTLRSQITNNQVTVEMDCVDEPDLTKLLAEIRKEYEDMIQKNKMEAELWYKSKLETITTDVNHTNKELDIAKEELNSKRQAVQTLEMELDIIRRQNLGLENILSDTEQRHEMEFNKLQITISKLEGDLVNIRNEMLQHKERYETLLKTKLTLEAEVAEYRRLLNGEISTKAVLPPPPRPPTPPSEVTTRKIVKVITTTLIDGKVVDESSEVEEFSEKKHI